MTDEQLNAIEARANAATPGPWEAFKQKGAPNHCIMAQVFGPDELGGESIAAFDYTGKADADAAFVAAAREDVPALVAEVRRLQADLIIAIDHAGDMECRLMEGYAVARDLFLSMKQQHYPDSEAMQDQTTVGVVLQISNMAAGLRRPSASWCGHGGTHNQLATSKRSATPMSAIYQK